MAAARAPLRTMVRFGRAARGGNHGSEATASGAVCACRRERRPAVRSAVLLRLVLTNGRRAELEISDVLQLGEVLDMLERRA